MQTNTEKCNRMPPEILKHNMGNLKLSTKLRLLNTLRNGPGVRACFSGEYNALPGIRDNTQRAVGH